ncbi:FAD-dependent monooxygenase [Kitasatospora sp. NPDC091257]
MNTGIQDAHNLSWKLTAVLRRATPPARASPSSWKATAA